MKNFLLSLLDWIYKKKCYVCGRSKESAKLCSMCYEKIRFNSKNVNRKILKVDVYACGFYDTVLQKIIRGLKYYRQRELAYYQAKFMWEYWQSLGLEKDFIVVPVPLYKTRQKQRKYNHMELVALEFCKLSGYEYDFDLIKRIKDTKPQYRLKRHERMENLAGAFEVKFDVKPEKPLLLIDDICTTGSTFESMIVALNKKCVYNITCLATSTVE